MTPSIYPNLFKNAYPSLQGKNWVQTISAEDKAVFVALGMKHNDYGRMGGNSRAKIAKRDNRGRFTK